MQIFTRLVNNYALRKIINSAFTANVPKTKLFGRKKQTNVKIKCNA